MKKLILSLCLLMATMTASAITPILGNPISLRYITTYTNPFKPRPRTQMEAPIVTLGDYTLYFWNECALTVSIISEEDETIVFTATIAEEQESVILPSNLQGSYIIDIIRAEQVFEGEIELGKMVSLSRMTLRSIRGAVLEITPLN